MSVLIKFIRLFFISFGVMIFIIASKDIVRKLRPPKPNNNKIYILCERYINLCNNDDGYWLTDTEIQLYEELERHLKKIKIIK